MKAYASRLAAVAALLVTVALAARAVDHIRVPLQDDPEPSCGIDDCLQNR